MLVSLAAMLVFASTVGAQSITGVEEWSHTHRGTEIGRAGFHLAEINGAAPAEIVAAANLGSEDYTNRYWYVMDSTTLDVVDSSNVYGEVTGLEVVDTDGDGRDEVLVGADGNVEIWRWDAQEARLVLDQSFATGAARVAGLVWADLDADGTAEIAFTDGYDVFVHDAVSGDYESSAVGYGGGDLAAGQFDADPQMELAVGFDYVVFSGGAVLDGATLALEWQDSYYFGEKITTADLTGDGLDEIVCFGGYEAARVVDPATQSELWLGQGDYSEAGVLVDFDGDGQLEIVSSVPSANRIDILDPLTGLYEDSLYLAEHHATGIVAVDVHANPGVELIWADTLSNGTNDWLRVYDVANDLVLQQTEELRGPSGFSAGDIDASGARRIVETVQMPEGTGNRYQIFDLAGSLLFDSPAQNPGSFDAVATADVLGDGREEILAGTNSFSLRLQAFDDAGAGLWAPSAHDAYQIRAVQVADLDLDGQKEVALTSDNVAYWGAEGTVLVLDGATGVQQSVEHLSGLSGDLAFLRLANVDGTGSVEIVVGETGQGLRIWSGAALTQYSGLGLSALDTPDRDGDGTAEIVIGTVVGDIQVVEPVSGAIVETVASYGSAIRGLQVLDVNGDMVDDYIFVHERRLRVRSGLDGSELFTGDDMGTDEAGALDGVRAGDFDDDGHVEVWVDRGVVGTRMYELRAVVGEVPTVTIREPGDWEPTYCYLLPYGCQVYAEAEALDFEDYQIYEGWWTSSLEGTLYNKEGYPQTYYLANFDLNLVGNHEISFSVVDMDGNGASDSVTYHVYEENLSAPVVTITSPEEGAVIYEGQTVQFDATAIDPEAGDVSASISWFARPSNWLLWEGPSFTTSNLPLGTTQIDVYAWDYDLEGFGSVNVTVLPDPPPDVTISSPADATMVVEGTSLDFAGDAQDLEDGDLSASLDWQSDLQGGVGTGASFSTSSLIVGTHTITASATDSRSQVGSDSITVTITPNTVPAVTITAPADGSDFTETDPIGFTATATDTEDGDLTASIAWSSNLDGALGTGGSISVSTLSVGSHTITAAVTDSHGDPGFDSIQIVVDANEAPGVSISAPAPAQTFTETDPVDFTATATDAEEGDLTAGIAWSSDLDGALGTGGSISISTLSIGTHVVTASVTDGYGGNGSDTVTVTIEANSAPAVTIIEPPGSITVTETDPVLLEATASDTEDGDLTASLAWSSDLDGALGSGGSISVSTLSIGTHVITASVTDSHGDDGSDTVTVTAEANAGPAVSISLPTNGSSYTETDPVYFGATASDAEDGDLSADIVWSSDLDGALHSGASFSSATLTVGTHVITAAVTDSHGDNGSDSVTITVDANNAPTVSITAPANGSSSTETDPVAFAATASDVEDGSLTTILAWTSSLDGAIGNGGSFALTSLSVGTHVITAAVTDSHGDEGSDSVTITVNANNAPTVSITAPANGSSSTETDPVTFTATASDIEDGSLTTNLAWTSSLDGAIGSGGSFTLTSLSVGTHVVTAAVTDSHGDNGSDSVTITVDANNAPTVSITAPANGSTFTEGDLVAFTGSASDAEDGDLSAALTWTSNLDGGLGGGASLAVSTLSVGTHVITALVTDSHGAPGQAQITVQVIPAPVQVVLTSIAGEDGWILEHRENGEYGSDFSVGESGSQAVRAGDDNKDKQYRAVLSFDTSSIPSGVQILSAQLRVRRATVVGSNPYGTLGSLVADVKTGGFGGSTALAASDFEAAPDVTASATLSNPVADLDWAEGLLDTAGVAALDVNGTTQFRLAFQVDDDDDRSNDFLGFLSGEAATGDQPELVIVYQP